MFYFLRFEFVRNSDLCPSTVKHKSAYLAKMQKNRSLRVLCIFRWERGELKLLHFYYDQFQPFHEKILQAREPPPVQFQVFFIKISVKLRSRFSRSENSFLSKSESRSLRPPGLNRAHLDDYLSRPILGEEITPRDRSSKREIIFETLTSFQIINFPK